MNLKKQMMKTRMKNFKKGVLVLGLGLMATCVSAQWTSNNAITHTNDKVGIGTSNVGNRAKVRIYESDNTGGTTLLLSADEGKNPNILFSTGLEELWGNIRVDNKNGNMQFQTGNGGQSLITGMTIDAVGRVGIGQDDPYSTYPLTIKNNLGTNGGIRLENGPEVAAMNLQSNGDLHIIAGGAGESIKLMTGEGNGTSRMTIQDNGIVNIPGLVETEGSYLTGFRLKRENTTNSWRISPNVSGSAGGFAIYQEGNIPLGQSAERFGIHPNGGVGIGMAPNSGADGPRLSLGGDMAITGDIKGYHDGHLAMYANKASGDGSSIQVRNDGGVTINALQSGSNGAIAFNQFDPALGSNGWTTPMKIEKDGSINVAGELSIGGLLKLNNGMETNNILTTGDVEIQGNLLTHGEGRFLEAFTVDGKATFKDEVQLVNDLIVNSNGTVAGTFRVHDQFVADGASKIDNTLEVREKLTVTDDIEAYGNVKAHGALTVEGMSNLNNGLHVYGGVGVLGDTRMSGRLNVTEFGHFENGGKVDNGLEVLGGMTVEGDAHFKNNVQMDRELHVTEELHVAGLANVRGEFRVGDYVYFEDEARIDGVLEVHGVIGAVAGISSEAEIVSQGSIIGKGNIISQADDNGGGKIIAEGRLSVGTTATVNGLTEARGGLTIGSSYSFPLIDGTDGQVLRTDGLGNLTWQDAGTGSSPILPENNEAGATEKYLGSDGSNYIWKAFPETYWSANGTTDLTTDRTEVSMAGDLNVAGAIVLGGASAFSNANNGNVDLTNSYSLIVSKGILSEGLKIALDGEDDWADYVFADNYQLMSLEEVEQFVEANDHLPNVPSAAAMAENGMDVAKTNAMLMEKVEELTLYVIELNKQLKAQQDIIETIK